MNNKGFTAIELIIVLGISLIIFTLGWSGTSLIRTMISQSRIQDLHHMMGYAGRNARSAQHGSAWGVYIPYDDVSRKASEVIIFSGDSYATRNPDYDLSVLFSEDVKFVNVSLSGAIPSSGDDHEIVFSSLSGDTSQYGSIILEYMNKQELLEISKSGIPILETL
ncbi:MAG: prepilin-type N-terminal cleavage/methylation domain-containing protein [Patescibacteria group bacterium]